MIYCRENAETEVGGYSKVEIPGKADKDEQDKTCTKYEDAKNDDREAYL